MDTGSPFTLLRTFRAYIEWYHELVEGRPDHYDTIETKAEWRAMGNTYIHDGRCAAEYCCHACGYIGNESAYPDDEATTCYEKDADSNYLWHDPACPECGEVEPFGYTSDCPFNHDA